MTEDPFEFLRQFHTLEGVEVPGLVVERSGPAGVELAWRNELGGLTFRVRDGYLKWNPRSTGIDLARERRRLEWLSVRHPAPRVLEFGEDQHAQWLVTAPLPGTSAVGDAWRARRPEAIRAIAEGLRAIHAVPVSDVSAGLDDSWVVRTPASIGPRPPIADPVLVHGDACAPNTLVGEDGRWSGHVDLGDMAVGDRWADLAIASMSLDWNYGEGHQHELFEAYGIEPDEERIAWYRALWDLES
ncbi:MAG TPA: aminoglycoside 3'-phosphotransferase [Candidatus Limnocylindrales bacterium]|nr:aminoglycoside 3'-phosphotransferase [Candidatus Limnocylindrales bacterium]